MKKIYSLIALAFAAMSANADVVLTMGGEVCDPTKTVEVYAEVENYGTDEDPYISIKCGFSDPCIKNTGSATTTFTVTIITDEYEHFQSCISGNCVVLQKKETVETSDMAGALSLEAGKSRMLELHGEFGGFDDDYNPIWGPEFYTSHTATVILKEGSKSKTYNLKYIYDASCDEKAGLSSGVNTVLRAEDNAPRYDLQGRRTDSTVNGLFIKGGRKYIQK